MPDRSKGADLKAPKELLSAILLADSFNQVILLGAKRTLAEQFAAVLLGASMHQIHALLSLSPVTSNAHRSAFLQRFRPMTVEKPKVLLPLLNVPLINYTLEWLIASGVDEVCILDEACIARPCMQQASCVCMAGCSRLQDAYRPCLFGNSIPTLRSATRRSWCFAALMPRK